MSSTTRFLRLVTIPGLVIALGCASAPPSSSGPEDLESQSPPAEATIDSEQIARPQVLPPKLTPVYFETDRSLLLPAARDALKQYATQILEHPEWGVLTIDGHCDERGSEQYNLALGERRASVVMRYLMDLGVPKSRLVSRTFGEEMPAIVGHDESAWHFNRRSEIKIEAVESTRR